MQAWITSESGAYCASRYACNLPGTKALLTSLRLCNTTAKEGSLTAEGRSVAALENTCGAAILMMYGSSFDCLSYSVVKIYLPLPDHFSEATKVLVESPGCFSRHSTQGRIVCKTANPMVRTVAEQPSLLHVRMLRHIQSRQMSWSCYSVMI